MDEVMITMSSKEFRRLRAVEAALAERITNAEGAAQVKMSVRQFIRLRGRVAKEGPQGVIHKGRGKVSPRKLADAERERIGQLLSTTYAGFNDSHATEMLVTRDGITVSRETVRRIRVATGRPAARRRRAPKHRSRRERRSRQGAMVLLDASTHRWLEDRAGYLTLLGAVDDATGEVLALRFEPVEDLTGYLSLMEELFTRFGIPASLYTDRHGVFHNNNPSKQSIEQQLAGEERLTQFARAIDELGIARIYSLSPQARGRVERLWGTLQDRLVSELRLASVETPEAAQAFLPDFLSRHNARFAKPAAEVETEWLAPPKDLEWFLCAKYRRVVAGDNTVRLQERMMDIPPGPHRCSYAAARVEVHELRDGRVRVVFEGRVIAEAASPHGFGRLRCRKNRPLLEPGDLPVAVLRHACPLCQQPRRKAAIGG